MWLFWGFGWLHLDHTLSSSSSSCPESLSLSLLLLTYGQEPNHSKTLRIKEENHTFVFVRSIQVQRYSFQVRKPLFSRRTRDPRFGHCSCTHELLRFREFEACRKLSKVLRKLGVVHWKVLDVGIVSCRFGRIL